MELIRYEGGRQHTDLGAIGTDQEYGSFGSVFVEPLSGGLQKSSIANLSGLGYGRTGRKMFSTCSDESL
jgi:hypothetical protein